MAYIQNGNVIRTKISGGELKRAKCQDQRKIEEIRILVSLKCLSSKDEQKKKIRTYLKTILNCYKRDALECVFFKNRYRL